MSTRLEHFTFPGLYCCLRLTSYCTLSRMWPHPRYYLLGMDLWTGSPLPCSFNKPNKPKNPTLSVLYSWDDKAVFRFALMNLQLCSFVQKKHWVH